MEVVYHFYFTKIRALRIYILTFDQKCYALILKL